MEAEDFELGLIVRKAHGDGDQEAVELRLGEGESAGGGGIVLGGNDEEGIGEFPSGAINGDLPLVHGFEERRLGAGGGAVDLVGEEEVGEDGACDEFKVSVLRTVELVAEDV